MHSAESPMWLSRRRAGGGSPAPGDVAPKRPADTAQIAGIEQDAEEIGVRLRDRYGMVLVLLLGGYLVGGLDDSVAVRIATGLVYAFILLVSLWAPGLPWRIRRAGASMTLVVLSGGVAVAFGGTDTTKGLTYLAATFLGILAIVAIIARIVQHHHVSVQTIMGGVAAYALLAFVWASLYQGVDLLTDDPFFGHAVASGDYLYFSFVTLTTTGYGDLTAATTLGKRLVVIEAFVAQVFLVTLVARLVSLWGQPLRARDSREE